MKNLILACSLFALATLCNAQNSIFPDIPYTNLAYVDSEGDNIFAIGFCELAMYSTNGGDSWDYLSVSPGFYRDLKIVPSSSGPLAVFIENSGMTAFNFNTKELSSIDISSIEDAGSLRTIEVRNGKLYVTSDTKIYSSELPTVNWDLVSDVVLEDNNFIISSFINDTHLYLGTSDGQVYSATLSGGDFGLLYEFENRVRAFYLFDDGVGFATIQSASKPMKTTDGGASWSAMDEFGENAKLYAYDADNLLTANTNRFYVSTDGGATTHYVPLFDNSDIDLINHASFAANGDLYLVGNSSTIIKSADVGLTYDNLNDYNRSDLGTISFVGDMGVVTGTKAVLLTEDGGDSWSSFDVSQIIPVDGYVNSAVIIADDEILVGHDDGYAILKNGSLQSEETTPLSSIFYLSESGIIIAVTEDGGERQVMKSTDNGATWSTKYTTEEYLNEFRMTESGKIYCPVPDGYIFSEDDGENWSVFTNEIEGYVSDMQLFDDGTGIFSISGSIYESSDAGLTMTEAGSGYALNNLHFITPEHYVYTQLSSGNTTIREKKAENENSTIVENTCGAAAGSFLQDDILWLTFRGGHIKKYDFSADPPNSAHQITASPLAIHPNPSAVGTELQFSDRLAEAGHLQIFDQLGQLKWNDTQFTGSSLVLSSARFSAGTYFISLKADGQHFRSKLIILDQGK